MLNVIKLVIYSVIVFILYGLWLSEVYSYLLKVY